MNSDTNKNLINPLYIYYTCKKNHNLQFTGADLINNKETNCTKCQKAGKNTLRWECKTCQFFFCQFCFPLVNFYKCPKNHLYKPHYFDAFNHTTLTCDFCFEDSLPKGNHMVDMECNLCFCLKCVKDDKTLVSKIQED